MLTSKLDDIFDAIAFPSRVATTWSNVKASYPPYNIIRLSDTETVLEFAVAGFTENEVTVVVEDGYLKIAGRKDETSEKRNYIHRGIGTRAFEKIFRLGNDMLIESAEFSDGLLSIYIRYELPEEKKPKVIPIKGNKATALPKD